MASATSIVPTRIQSRYPSIGQVRDPFGKPIFVSSTPNADWSGFHFDMGGGVQAKPQAPGTARDQFGNLIGSSAPYIKPLAITKDPAGAAAGDSLLEAFNQARSQMPDLTAMLSQLQGRYNTAQGNVDAAFSDQQASLDPTEWINSRRARDTELANLTAGYEGNLGAIGNRYSDILKGYDTSGRQIVDEILSKGQDYIDTIIPKQRDLALGNALTYLDKYGIQNAGAGGGTGASSGGATLAGRAISDAVLPYMAQAQQMQQELRRNVQLPFEGDIANRYTSKVTGFDMPVASEIYNRYGAVNAQQRSTDDAVYSAKQAAASGRVQSAIGQLMSVGMSVQQMAQALQLPVQLVAQQAQALAQILGNRNVSTQFGVEDIRGSNVTMPEGPNLRRPTPYVPDYSYGDIPSRYGGVAMNTGAPAIPGLSGPQGEGSMPSRYGWGPSADQMTLSTYQNPKSPTYMGGGIYDLPNDYKWGRNPTEQAVFESIQNYYE